MYTGIDSGLREQGDWLGIGVLVIVLFFLYPDTSLVELMGAG